MDVLRAADEAAACAAAAAINVAAVMLSGDRVLETVLKPASLSFDSLDSFKLKPAAARVAAMLFTTTGPEGLSVM